MELLERTNVQIYPSKTLCFPNDRFAKVLFNLTAGSFRDMTEGNNTHNLVEIRNHRKFGKIVSPYKIFADEHAALAVIYRGLTGKVKKGTDAMPGVDQFAAIMNSINKLVSLRVDISMKDYCENLGCNNGETFQLVQAQQKSQYLSFGVFHLSPKAIAKTIRLEDGTRTFFRPNFKTNGQPIHEIFPLDNREPNTPVKAFNVAPDASLTPPTQLSHRQKNTRKSFCVKEF